LSSLLHPSGRFEGLAALVSDDRSVWRQAEAAAAAGSSSTITATSNNVPALIAAGSKASHERALEELTKEEKKVPAGAIVGHIHFTLAMMKQLMSSNVPSAQNTPPDTPRARMSPRVQVSMGGASRPLYRDMMTHAALPSRVPLSASSHHIDTPHGMAGNAASPSTVPTTAPPNMLSSNASMTQLSMPPLQSIPIAAPLPISQLNTLLTLAVDMCSIITGPLSTLAVRIASPLLSLDCDVYASESRESSSPVFLFATIPTHLLVHDSVLRLFVGQLKSSRDTNTTARPFDVIQSSYIRHNSSLPLSACDDLSINSYYI
jgi:hypothetical protein